MFFTGFCGAPLWSAKCAYVTTSGIKLSKAANLNEDNTITNFFGIFFLIFQTGQIWGNLISSQVLKPSGGQSNSSVLDVGRLCGANFCPSTPISAQNQQTSHETVITLMSIYLTFGCLAIVVVFFFLDKCKMESNDEEPKGACDLFIATLKHFMKDRKMQLLIPLTMFSGLEQGFVFSDFTKAFITCSIGIEMVGLIMICFGVVDAIFSLVLGKIVEWWTGRPIMMFLGAVINMALLVTFLLWHPTKDSLYVFFLGAGFWGFADAVWQTQVNAFYGVLFPTKQEAAFSNYRLWESLGFVISFAYGDFLCTDIKIYILMVVLVIGISLYGVIELMRRKESRDEYSLSMQQLEGK